ncbi:MAG: helix-turn-helix domain-containing protein [Butyricicoccus sp.]
MSLHNDTAQLFTRVPELVYVTEQNSNNRRINRCMHRHDDVCELVFICSGKGTYTCEGGTCEIYPGDFLLANQGDMHEVHSLLETEIGDYCFGISNLQLSGREIGQLGSVEEGFVRPARDRLTEMKAICRSVYDRVTSTDTCVRASAHYLFMGMLMTALCTPADARTQRNTREVALANRIQKYIAAHFTEPLTLETISEELNISPYYVSHVFKQEYGFSPIHFMIRCRIGEAQNLLISSDYSATQIGSMVGYETTNHFNAMFKKNTGVPPVQYRRNYFEQMRGRRCQ